MDFQFSAQHDLLRKSVREFAEGAIAPKVAHMEETDEVPWDIYKEMAKQMYMGILIPKEFGGTAFGNLARMIMLEEVGRVSAAVAMALQIFHLGTAPIIDFGNEAQKKKYLPALAKGESLSTIAVTEATGGSDPTGIQSTAKLQGDNYILNGRKCFITNSHVADVMTIMAKTGEGPKGFSAFIVEKSFPGFKPGRKEKKFGLHGCNTGEMAMENCAVPRENLLANEGDGLKLSMAGISEVGRAGMAGVGLGVITACLEASVKFANERVLGGKPISQHQGIQWMISDIYIDLEASRLLAYRAAWMRDQKMRCDSDMAMAKFYATEAAVRCAKKAVDIHGGYGYMMEYPVQRYYRDAEILIASAGTSEIQRIVMARKALTS
ncbi:MAG: acyl-CoA dehydrogenase family protein, partial [Thermodesulfobacteriota bacterium]|nr:acyl-CoA dehydrogenase family protein [Thermodesulfobacteriota bacterium]